MLSDGADGGRCLGDSALVFVAGCEGNRSSNWFFPSFSFWLIRRSTYTIASAFV
jgi:hypothetical protein